MREGWQCPVCGRGNSPDAKTCPCKPRVLSEPWKWTPPTPPYPVGAPDPRTFPTVRFVEPPACR